MSRRARVLALLCGLAGCAHAPPLVLDDAARAVLVLRSDQATALELARRCEPLGATTRPSDDHLRLAAAERGANVAEVLYDAAGSTAVLHRCPPDTPRDPEAPQPERGP